MSATERPDTGLPLPELLDTAPVRLPSTSRRDGSAEVPKARHPRRWAVWAIVLTMVGTTAAVGYVDHRAGVGEATALATCEHRLAEASAMSEIKMGAMVNYLRPARSKAAELHLADLMSSPARSVLPRVQRAHRACEQVRIEPWHFSLMRRRTAAVAYSGALITLVETVAAQGRAYAHPDPTLLRLRQAAGIE